MSDEELAVVNAFIGFCTLSDGTWPGPFCEDQYVVTGIERPINVTVRGADRSPTPELISTSDSRQHCVVLEAKSGSVSDKQARGYAATTVRDLVVQGLATPQIDSANANLDVLYMASEGNLERLIADFGRSNVSFPIVAFGETSFQLVHDLIQDEKMHFVFVDGIEINVDHWPRHFVQCDRESSAGQLASVVMKKLAVFAFEPGEFTILELCAASIDFWEERGPNDRRQFRDNVTSLIEDAVKHELRGYLTRVGRDQRWRRVGRKTWSAQTTDRFSEAIEVFVYRKATGNEYMPGQLSLFGPDIGNSSS